MTENIRLQLGQKSIQIGFTDQRLSPLAGMLSLAGYLFRKKVPDLLEKMGVLAEAKMVVNFWLRAGNTATINNALGFLAELLSRLPRHVRLRLVRADSGFCATSLFEFLEERKLPYVVAARLLRPIRSLITKGLIWQPTEIAGTCVAQMFYQETGWKQPRRLILIRHEVQDRRRVGGRRLIDCPGYLFQALVTSLPDSVNPLDVWRQYNGRAGIEGVIKELRHGYGLHQFCCQDFWATEAALSMGIMAYNLVELFGRFLGWAKRYALSSLRFHLFVCAGVISRTAGITTIKLAQPPRRRAWWTRLWERIASPFPNCNAVEPLST